MRRTLTVALACLVAIGALAFAVDASTIRIVPDASLLKPAQYTAVPGELVRVELSVGWTPVRTSNPEVLEPLGENWFITASPGRATLSAASIRCPQCEEATFLWRVDFNVRLPGT